jgi:hypothetical protein
MKEKIFLSLLSFVFLLAGCGGPSASTVISGATTKSSSGATTSLQNSSQPEDSHSAAVSSSTPSSSATASASSTSSPSVISSSSSSYSNSDNTPTMKDLLTQSGAKTAKGIVHGVEPDGYFLSDPTGYLFVKNPTAISPLARHRLNAVATTPQEGDYVKAQGNLTSKNGYLELDLSNASDATVLTNETPNYTLPTPKKMTAIELSGLFVQTYQSWAEGGDRSGARAPIPSIPYEICLEELRVYPQDANGLCLALGPGLTYLSFSANFQDGGHLFESAPYELSFFLLGFGTSTCTLGLTAAKKLTPEFPYTTIADLKKNPTRAAHYNIQGKIMGVSSSQYVVDDGTGRLYVNDSHYAGESTNPDQAIGSIVSISGTLSQDFSEPHYELTVYSLSTTIEHQPKVSLNTVIQDFPTEEYPNATNGKTPYWVSERFTCTLRYKSGGNANDPLLRCYSGELYCVIVNYKALPTLSAEFTFTGYMIYGEKNVANLLYDGHTEAAS